MEDRVVVAERQHLDQSRESLAARDRGSLPAARIKRGDTPMRSGLVLGERRRKALVDVLGREHHDRQIARRSREPLPRSDAEGLLVHVEHVGSEIAHDASKRLGVQVGVAVDITGPAHRQLDEREVLVRHGRLGAIFRPMRWDDESDVEPSGDECALPRPVRCAAAAVVDA